VTLIYGHRGAKGEAPENTLNSFRQCLSHGVIAVNWTCTCRPTTN